ncbi:MAG: valine--tRNA ligase [Candidatus Doudnabacteria bacterium]|nr:valine--tRNA ligase [Candidatus Doudnabacteria bacterium]
MLPKGPYNPNETESKILDFWHQNKFFKPEFDPRDGEVKSTEEMKQDDREPFAIICPPPNAYARPHIGNVSGYAYQDVFGRYARMRGKKTLLFPGKDHAAQEAETIYLRDVLAPQGKSKADFTREEFYAACYEYFTGIMLIAQADEKRIGLSADFDRDLFTLDPRVFETVMGTFIKMYEDGMVYKDVRIVNWSPGMQSVVADIDTARKEREAELIYIKYPLVEDPTKFVAVATTRPETMLGDTAVVVDPTDERYADLIGKYVKLPLTDREIPIIANGRVDKEFGTGAVKLTPAHSADDYTMMLEWNYKKDFNRMPQNVQDAREQIGAVGYINIIWKDLKLVGPVGKYKGMKVNAARAQIVEDLRALDLIEKTEKITQNVVICDRTKSVIEPIMSSQWFIDVDRLKQPALEALKAGEVTIHPDNMSKKLEFWLQNLRDWPISRSIWWGYRIPVWYKGEISEVVNDEGKIVIQIAGEDIADMQDAVKKGLIKVQTDSPGEGWLQDPDVFDTWFSSGQWPFATLTAENLMDTFYPTQIMETAFDILELWVARMIMLGIYTQGKVPFKDVYLHGLINAPDGQKMSKSKGNNINIDEIVEKYGADTLRMLYIVGNKAGASYRVDFDKLEGYRRFLNKIWNAAKFVEMNMPENHDWSEVPADLKIESNKKLYQHILDTHAEVTKLMNGFNIGIAAQVLFENFWHVFCDVCLEEAKPNLYPQKDKQTQEVISEPDPVAKTETQQVLGFALITYLKLLHPFVPFLTEEIWQHIKPEQKKESTLGYENWELS